MGRQHGPPAKKHPAWVIHLDTCRVRNPSKTYLNVTVAFDRVAAVLGLARQKSGPRQEEVNSILWPVVLPVQHRATDGDKTFGPQRPDKFLYLKRQLWFYRRYLDLPPTIDIAVGIDETAEKIEPLLRRFP